MQSRCCRFHVLIFILAVIDFHSVAAVSGDAVVKLSGDISLVHFDSPDQIYLIDSTIEIPGGTSVTIPPGTVFLFQRGTSFIINGSFTVAGTSRDTVVFTSINDQRYYSSSTSPTPFDWQGITVTGSAEKVIFKHLYIKYAKLSIDAEPSTIALDTVYRSQTKSPYFIISGDQYKVKNDEIFVYNTTPRIDTLIMPPTTAPPEIPEPVAQPAEYWWKKKQVRYSLLGTGSGALLTLSGWAIGYFINYSDSVEAMKHYWDENERDFTYRRNEKKKALEAGKNIAYFKNASIVSGVIGAVLLSGFTLTFLY